MGRIVIETDPASGLDKVELTLDDGSVMRFAGSGRSELRFKRGATELVDVSTGGDREYIPGRRTPDTWEFNVSIDKIGDIEKETPCS